MDKRTKDILATLKTKTAIRNRIESMLVGKFDELRNVIRNITLEYNQALDAESDLGLQLTSKLAGDHVIQLEIGEDMLLFVRHNSIFQFDRDHGVWKQDYVTQDPSRSYSGIISVYNFLSDSFRFDRDEDLGYMIARLFINAEGAFFVEGKRQRSMGVDSFGKCAIDAVHLRKFVETAMRYAIDFDLLAPPYDAVKVTDLIHMKMEIQSSKSKTGKRLGFQFNSDDVR